MRILFHGVRELFEDMHRHVRRTGDSVLPADVPGEFPPLVGWAAVGKDASGQSVEPMEERHWVISLSGFGRTLDSFLPDWKRQIVTSSMKTHVGRVKLAEEVLKLFCPKCGFFGLERGHTDEECIVYEVIGS